MRRTGGLELLLTTPVGAENIVSDQWKVLQRVFIWPVVVMQAPLLPMILGGATAPSSASPSGLQLPGALLTLGNTFLGATALCRLSLWLGLRARSQAGAIVWAVGLAVGLPALFNLVCAVLFVNAASAGRGGLPQFSPFSVLAGIATLGFFLWLVWFARQMLANELAGVEGRIQRTAWPPLLEGIFGTPRQVNPNV